MVWRIICVMLFNNDDAAIPPSIFYKVRVAIQRLKTSKTACPWFKVEDEKLVG